MNNTEQNYRTHELTEEELASVQGAWGGYPAFMDMDYNSFDNAGGDYIGGTSSAYGGLLGINAANILDFQRSPFGLL